MTCEKICEVLEDEANDKAEKQANAVEVSGLMNSPPSSMASWENHQQMWENELKIAMFVLQCPEWFPEVQAASVADDRGLEAMLQDVGIGFLEVSPEDGVRRKGT